jgi:hypothetical protein
MVAESTYVSFEVKNKLAIEKLKELRGFLVPIDEVIEDLLLRVDTTYYISLYEDN